MFSSREYLNKKTGPYGIGRFNYLQSLVTEFQGTQSDDAKLQVLANLANFSYDPINFDYLRQLNVVDLFLDCLTESQSNLIQYGIAGICNLALDKQLKKDILDNDGVQLIIQCLSSSDEETVLSAITTLMFLVTPESKPVITAPAVVDAMLRFSTSRNSRISNLANVFLQDMCTEEQLQKARDLQAAWTEQINVQADRLNVNN